MSVSFLLSINLPVILHCKYLHVVTTAMQLKFVKTTTVQLLILYGTADNARKYHWTTADTGIQIKVMAFTTGIFAMKIDLLLIPSLH